MEETKTTILLNIADLTKVPIANFLLNQPDLNIGRIPIILDKNRVDEAYLIVSGDSKKIEGITAFLGGTGKVRIRSLPKRRRKNKTWT